MFEIGNYEGHLEMNQRMLKSKNVKIQFRQYGYEPNTTMLSHFFYEVFALVVIKLYNSILKAQKV